jgi:hypothetical protein
MHEPFPLKTQREHGYEQTHEDEDDRKLSRCEAVRIHKRMPIASICRWCLAQQTILVKSSLYYIRAPFRIVFAGTSPSRRPRDSGLRIRSVGVPTAIAPCGPLVRKTQHLHPGSPCHAPLVNGLAAAEAFSQPATLPAHGPCRPGQQPNHDQASAAYAADGIASGLTAVNGFETVLRYA